MHIFTTYYQKQHLLVWRYNVEDNSITTKLFTPLWNFMLNFIPIWMAPNTITLLGFVCVILSTFMSFYNNTIIKIAVCVLTFLYICLDALDGKQARRTNSSSPLGELFDHACDNISITFLFTTLFNLGNVNNLYVQWYIIQGAQLLFLLSHIDAYKTKIVKFSKYGGPNEMLFIYIIIILSTIYFDYVFVDNLEILINISYWYVVYISMVKIFMLDINTRDNFIFSLMLRSFPHKHIFKNMSPLTVFSSGLLMSILSSDIILAKMSNRELHKYVPIIMMLSLLGNYVSLVLMALYYLIVFLELSLSLNIPMFKIKKVER